jgi:hypothetical protein
MLLSNCLLRHYRMTEGKHSKLLRYDLRYGSVPGLAYYDYFTVLADC